MSPLYNLLESRHWKTCIFHNCQRSHIFIHFCVGLLWRTQENFLWRKQVPNPSIQNQNDNLLKYINLDFKFWNIPLDTCSNKCGNYVPQWWVELGCLLIDSTYFIIYAENSQILLKIYVIPILLNFIYLVALNLSVNNQLNSLSNSTHHCGT